MTFGVREREKKGAIDKCGNYFKISRHIALVSSISWNSEIFQDM